MSDNPKQPRFTAPVRRGFMLIAAALLTDTEYGLYDPKHIHRRSIKGAGNLKDWDAACRFIEFHANQEANKTGGVPDAEPPTNPVPSAS